MALWQDFEPEAPRTLEQAVYAARFDLAYAQHHDNPHVPVATNDLVLLLDALKDK